MRKKNKGTSGGMGHIRVGYGKRSSRRSTPKGTKTAQNCVTFIFWYESTSSVVRKICLITCTLFKSPVKTSIKKCFPLAEVRKKRKTFFSRTSGSLGASVRWVYVSWLVHGSAWHGYQLCLRRNINLGVLILCRHVSFP